mmetsp:Transcript_67414/g.160812  ORF Transcript_67414/g.160812 Transcript_67414/m.160812 type:complete len:363 (-) Transcript_67414:150-1238(-)
MSEDLVDRLQDELDEGARLLRIWRGFLKLALLCVVVHVSPKAFSKNQVVKTETMRFGVDCSIRLQGEHHSEQSRGEDHIPLQRRKVDSFVDFRSGRVVELLHGLVDVFDAVPQLVISICRRQLQLHDEAIEAVNDENYFEVVLKSVFEHSLDVLGEADNHVNHQNDAISQSQSCYHFVLEVAVARSVHRMKEVGLVLGILQDQAHGGGFHRDAAILLVLPGVRVAYLFSHLPVLFMSVQHEEVHEGGLPMVHGTQETNVANQVGLVHHGSEEIEVKGRVRHLLLQEIEVFGLNRRDDGIRQRLGVFHLDQSFCVAVDFFCIRVILLVFVQNDLPVTTRLNALHGHVTHPGAIIISLAFLLLV